MRSELLKGYTELLLLETVSRGPAHGYLIIERLRESSGGGLDLPEGTVYPALHRLEQSGVIQSRWDDTGSRRRRVYEITSKGRGALRSRRAEWSQLVQTMSSVIGVARV
jgi:PadR family transcriptional regulator PadR